MAGGGIDTLARPTSPSVASVSACRLFRVEDVLDSSFIEDCERADSPDVVRERGSVEAIGSSDKRHRSSLRSTLYYEYYKNIKVPPAN